MNQQFVSDLVTLRNLHQLRQAEMEREKAHAIQQLSHVNAVERNQNKLDSPQLGDLWVTSELHVVLGSSCFYQEIPYPIFGIGSPTKTQEFWSLEYCLKIMVEPSARDFPSSTADPTKHGVYRGAKIKSSRLTRLFMVLSRDIQHWASLYFSGNKLLPLFWHRLPRRQTDPLCNPQTTQYTGGQL